MLRSANYAARTHDAKAKNACRLVLKACAFGAVIAFQGSVISHTAEARDVALSNTLAVKAQSLPVKTRARLNRSAGPAASAWDTDVPARIETAARTYTPDVVRQHTQSLALELSVIAATSIFFGVKEWGWGETRFHTSDEGWFGKSTAYGGTDKLGHAWSAHVMSDHLTSRLQNLGFDKYQSAITAALLTSVAFFAVEIGDGFSHFGASREDFFASMAGVGFSFLRNTVPGLNEKIDFRMQYIPTGHGDTFGLGDYSGKKFLLAWKFAGLEPFREGPFRYLEIHTGYYTRGYSDWEKTAGIPQSRSPYIGIGLNLSELLFSSPAVRNTPVGQIGRDVLRYIQVPYTYISTGSTP